MRVLLWSLFFFFNDTATTEIYTRSIVGSVRCVQETGTWVMKQAIAHKGFALVDIFQPCVSFNKINTFKWFNENTYYLPEDFDNSDRVKSFEKALEEGPYPLGVIYKSNHRKTFEAVSYTHLRAHETSLHLVCRLLLEKKKKTNLKNNKQTISYSLPNLPCAYKRLSHQISTLIR
eukprot:TRINITY_DN44375_c0_g1_i1.p1 TRINITY_DN44375_c0_g1~~TRINITY_DN44375_c0_g1_i1.p1  ORF type:complete len:175 (-),score=30.44 TRINITY_DN44375_c0_g1_i1:2-526(-)